MDENITVKKWLRGMTATTCSNEKDWEVMQSLLRQLGFPGAIVTGGIVYLEGKGTLEAPPIDLHAVARMVLGIRISYGRLHIEDS